MSDANRVRVAMIAEDTFGVQKTGSNLQIIRQRGESLRQATQSADSQEIRSDRQIATVKRTNINAEGAIDIEMSYGTYDEWLQAVLQSSGWSSIVTVGPATTISAVNSDNSINDTGNGFGSINANQWIRVSGFTESANNGLFKVVTAAAGKLTLSGGTLTDEAAGDSVTVVQGAQIVNGTTQKSYNIERTYLDLTNKFALYTGMIPDTLQVNARTEEIITGSFGFVGSKEQSASSSGGSGYDAATTVDVMSAVDDILNIFENMVAYDATEVLINVNNNSGGRSKLGNLGAISVRSGTFNVTGNVIAYFEDETVMDKYLNNTTSQLALLLQDGAGNQYVIELPSIRYTDGRRVATGNNTDVLANMSYSAFMDATEGITMRIARFAA